MLIFLLAGVFVLAALCSPLSRALGRNAGYPLAAAFGAGAALLAVQAPAILAGRPLSAEMPWFPSLGVGLVLLLDGLAVVFALLVLGVGALVLAYSARYFTHAGSAGRVYGLLVLFAGSMLGLVLAADIIALFVFWELTSISSFFLIGGLGEEKTKKPATRALLVTSLGGLALFAGLVLLGVAGGTFDLTAMLTDPEPVREHVLAPAILALVLLGAFTKSAQFPFQFWLSGAMVAPTPVSTYLHAATMVKAGIYLLARLVPVLGGTEAFLYAVVLTGLVTAVVGGVLALKQTDLKALLAYSTVSQLGFIIALVGVGTPDAMKAAVLHTVAHAAFKATLFMVAGIVEAHTGTRDLRALSGVGRAMPATAAVAVVAGLSMAGLPPLLGFVSKEEAFAALLEAPALAPLAAGLAVVAAMATFAYTARFLHGTFAGPAGGRAGRPPRSFLAPAAVTALAGLVLGPGAPVLDALVGAAAGDALGTPVEAHLALWHGLTPELALSAVAIAGGALLFAGRRGVEAALARARTSAGGEAAFDRAHEAAIGLGRVVGAPFLATAPARHLIWVILVALTGGVWAWTVFGELPTLPPPTVPAEDWAVITLLALAAGGVAVARRRMAAVAVLGVAGFLLALFFVLLGAPDLAITQLLIETLTVALIVLVFRRLPPLFKDVSVVRRVGTGAVALVVGALAGLGAYVLTGRREVADSPFLEAAPLEAGGRNVVNVILVDFRALDTLGEITVIAVAAIGVSILAGRLRERRR